MRMQAVCGPAAKLPASQRHPHATLLGQQLHVEAGYGNRFRGKRRAAWDHIEVCMGLHRAA